MHPWNHFLKILHLFVFIFLIRGIIKGKTHQVLLILKVGLGEKKRRRRRKEEEEEEQELSAFVGSIGR